MNGLALEMKGRVFFRQSVLRAVPVIASVAVGLTLMAAALMKASDPRDALAVLEFVFGDAASRPLLNVLIGFEILLGSALIAVFRAKLMLLVAAGLFVVFLGWIGYLEIVDSPVTCGCGFKNTHWFVGDGRGAAALRAGTLLAVCLVGAAGSWFGFRVDTDKE